MAELVDETIELLAPWPTAVSLAMELGFDSAKAAATGAQLSVPLVIAGMTHRLDDPSAGNGITDILKTVDPSSLPDVARMLAERSYEPAGSEAANVVFGHQYQRVLTALATESGCEVAHAAAVLAPATWLVMAGIVHRYGIGHDRQSLLGLVGREHRDLARDGWEQWMSIVDPDPIVVPAPMAPPELDSPVPGTASDQTVSAEQTYPPPQDRHKRAGVPAARQTSTQPDPTPGATSTTGAGPQPIRDQPPLPVQGHRRGRQRNPFPDTEPAEAGVGFGAGSSRADRSAPDPAPDSPAYPERESKRPLTRGRSLMIGSAVLLLLVGGALAWFWYNERNGEDLSTPTTGTDISANAEGAEAAGSAQPDAEGADQPEPADADVPSVVSMNVILDDPAEVSNATASAALQFNREELELCYDIKTTGAPAEISGQIVRGPLGEEGVPLVELGSLDMPAIGCQSIESAAMTTILADPGSHYVSVFSADGATAIRSQLNGMTRPPTPEGLRYDPDGEGAFVILRDGTLEFEGPVPDAETANLLIAEFADFQNDESVNNLEVVPGAPLPSGRIVVADQLFFESGSAVPGARQQATLEQLAPLFIARTDWKIVVLGHTDSSGDPQSNLELSRLRARSVRDALIELGVDKRSIRSDGLGDTEAVASNDTAEGRSENRRIEFRIELDDVDS